MFSILFIKLIPFLVMKHLQILILNGIHQIKISTSKIEKMIFVSATRLRIRSIFYLLKFMRANEGSIKQLLITRGFLGGKELVDKKLTFWTLTMWHDDVAMKSFRNSAAHKIAMQKLPYWCDEASYVHWMQEKAEIPLWGNVFKKMIEFLLSEFIPGLD